MARYSLSHLDDGVLLRDLKSLVAHDRETTASLLAHLAEVDARRLYAPAGHPSMFSYCVNVLGFSEDSAGRRIQAARLARRFPAVFPALADGRLHLTAVNLLSTWMTLANAEDLLAAAAHKTRAEIEQVLAERFPKPDVPALLAPVATLGSPSLAAQPVAADTPGAASDLAVAPNVQGMSREHALAHVPESCASTAPVPGPSPKVTPLSPERYALQVTLTKTAREALQRVQDLLGHELAPGDIAGALERALLLAAAELEKRKLATTEHPQRSRRPRDGSRHVPAAVKRAVWARDGGRCTFVSDDGQRCPSRRALEFDHIEPVARGGTATPSSIRLRCRTHNQLEAERVFGVAFMRGKRERGSRA